MWEWKGWEKHGGVDGGERRKGGCREEVGGRVGRWVRGKWEKHETVKGGWGWREGR